MTNQRVIWKYRLIRHGIQTLSMPRNAQILCVQNQDDIPTLWMLVDESAPREGRTFNIWMTGEYMNYQPNEKYIGTVQDTGGYVVHVFEELSKQPNKDVDNDLRKMAFDDDVRQMIFESDRM